MLYKKYKEAAYRKIPEYEAVMVCVYTNKDAALKILKICCTFQREWQ
jgi:hypothetical protein